MTNDLLSESERAEVERARAMEFHEGWAVVDGLIRIIDRLSPPTPVGPATTEDGR